MTQAKQGDPRSATVVTPDDLDPIHAQLADHESRLVALEAGGALPIPPDPSDLKFTFGLWYARTEDYPYLSAQGMTDAHDWVQPNGSSRGMLDRAAEYGMKVACEISWCLEGGIFYADRLASMMDPYQDHPAVSCWILYDEPDINNWSIAECRKMYDAFKARGAAQPGKVTIRYPWKTEPAPGWNGIEYAPYTDLVGVDPYIHQYGPTSQVGDETAASVPPAAGRPVAVDVQTFAWGNTFVPPDPYGEMPTLEQVREMTIYATQRQTHRERMIWFYDSAGMKSSPELWEGIGDVISAAKASVQPGATRLVVSPQRPWIMPRKVARPRPRREILR